MTINEPYGFIYITTNMINGKKYIGQKKFIKNWQSYLGSGTNLKRALKKYGRENFIRDIVAIAYNKEELDKLEEEFIAYHNASSSQDYYNISNIASSGYGLCAGLSEEKIKEKYNRIGKSISGKSNGMAKTIKCITTNEIFGTLREGAKKYNISEGSLRNCCNGKVSFAGKDINGKKLVWRYIDGDNIIEPQILYNRIKCITNEEIFDDIDEVAKYYNSNNETIAKCCRGEQAYILYNNKKFEFRYINNRNIIVKYNPYKYKNIIVCVNTNEIFNSAKEASEIYSTASIFEIGRCCRGEKAYSGRHPKTKQKLKWKYLE